MELSIKFNYKPQELDEEQSGIVNTLKKSTFVLGVPGGGKTRLLTELAKKLTIEGKSVLCICFTRSARDEMQSRLDTQIVSTIHSFCNSEVGWEANYQDMLTRYLDKKIKPSFDWVLLDECQDVSRLELDVVLATSKNLFAVGDTHQSIFGFQSALGTGILPLFSKLGMEYKRLHNSYRACPEVISKLESIFKRSIVSKAVKTTSLTAYLARTNKDITEASRFLNISGIPHNIVRSADYASDRGVDRETRVLKGNPNLLLMTIHVSKGREFDKVYVQDFPTTYAHNVPAPEEERLVYVGLSRASKECKKVASCVDIVDLLKGDITNVQ